MVSGVPRICISTTGQRRAATSAAAAGSWRSAETSLTTRAPASSAACMVAALRVSTETATPCAASARTTGRMRACSCACGTGSAPGRVLSPPTSTRSAPASAIASPAATGSAWAPPSLKLSGVTLSTAMIAGRPARPAQGGRGAVSRCSTGRQRGGTPATATTALPGMRRTSENAAGPPASGSARPAATASAAAAPCSQPRGSSRAGGGMLIGSYRPRTGKGSNG